MLRAIKTFSVCVVMVLLYRCSADIGLGTCNLQCQNDKGQTTTPHGHPVQLQGSPGKRGVKGEVGPKGEPGDRCECLEVSDLVEEIQGLKDKLLPRSCSDLVPNHGVDASGVYTIYPYGNLTGLQVYCDLATEGGWLIFQRRMDGSVDFFTNFTEFVDGFGKLNGEFWLGLQTLHDLTKDGGYELRVDMEDFENQTRFALYSTFVIGEGTSFTLTIGGYSGDAGDGIGGVNGARFSARDRDQDTWGSSCSNSYKGGWWYTACHAANPNGLYLAGSHESFADGINWQPWRGYHYSLKRMEMKIKRK